MLVYYDERLRMMAPKSSIYFGLVWLFCGLALMACQMEVEAEGSALGPVGPGIDLPDVGLPDIRPDVGEADVLIRTPDIGPTDGGTGPEELLAKGDESYLVPPSVSQKRGLSLHATAAAWVELVGPNSTPSLVYWDYGNKAEPTSLEVAYLKNPSDLRLGKDWLFYVDDIWGNRDVFGIRLADSDWRIVAGGPGEQTLGTAKNGRVLYEDCSQCLEGGPTAEASEIYEVNVVDEQAPTRLTTNKVNDTSPMYGTLGDGSTATVWVSNYDTPTVLDGNDVQALVQDVDWIRESVLIEGRLYWRASPAIINPDSMIPSPMIINPDSMIPSDLYTTDLQTGTSSRLTSHVEIDPTTPLEVISNGLEIAYAEGIAGSDRQRVTVLSVIGLTETVAIAEEDGIAEVALEDGVLGFIAPRPDNEGLDDVWLLPY